MSVYGNSVCSSSVKEHGVALCKIGIENDLRSSAKEYGFDPDLSKFFICDDGGFGWVCSQYMKDLGDYIKEKDLRVVALSEI